MGLSQNLAAPGSDGGEGSWDFLLKATLRRVSRSFYLTLRVLPASLRQPIGVAYLLARAADTIADTRMLPRAERLGCLQELREALTAGTLGPIGELPRKLSPAQADPAERSLLEHLADCFHCFGSLTPGDRERVRRLVLTITQGMQMDLERFPGERPKEIAALATRADLDRYTYLIAGCVGEFWTEIHLAHRKSLAGWDAPAMKALGIRFGQGLQLTNVLRDLPRDLRIGRCYLPTEDLARFGLTPKDLLEPAAADRLRPFFHELIRYTLDHYEAGWRYTLAIPAREFRMRLACAWPLLIGLGTLGRLARTSRFLDPACHIKVPRARVYGLVFASTATVPSNALLNQLFQRLRRRIPIEALQPAG
ncbi:MAG: phytoene/squalene synthase family protein [Candidatus Methylomirabilales bacterium]